MSDEGVGCIDESAWSREMLLGSIAVDITRTCVFKSRTASFNTAQAAVVPSRSREVPSVAFYLTPMGGRGPRLLELLWALGSESRGAERLLSPLPALALAEPVRLRT
jgi:hypothetical protein